MKIVGSVISIFASLLLYFAVGALVSWVVFELSGVNVGISRGAIIGGLVIIVWEFFRLVLDWIIK